MSRKAPPTASESSETPKPFLRWVGGKRLLASKLLEFLPTGARGRHYHEPFVGAASFFFALRPAKATLSDLNEHLIGAYSQVRDAHYRVARYLRAHAAADSKDYYYEVRDMYNRAGPGAAQAARFIYLNSTCFNGVFRVNVRGRFNVPYGDKPTPRLPSSEQLAAISESLAGTELRATSYDKAVETAEAGAFLYLDPPYPPLNGTSYFTHYTKVRFGHDDQEQLAAVVSALDRRGCLVMMTNADTPAIRSLYRDFNQHKLSVTRYVTCKKVRHRVGELVITNYDPSHPA